MTKNGVSLFIHMRHDKSRGVVHEFSESHGENQHGIHNSLVIILVMEVGKCTVRTTSYRS